MSQSVIAVDKFAKATRRVRQRGRKNLETPLARRKRRGITNKKERSGIAMPVGNSNVPPSYKDLQGSGEEYL